MSDAERREYSRVDAFISLCARLVPVDQRKGLRSRVSAEVSLSQFEPLPDLAENGLSESLRIINSKLDAILKILTFRDTDFCTLKISNVNISGSGICFQTKELYSLGDLIELKMVFPDAPDTIVCVYGEVVDFENSESGGCRASVRYTIIDEEIRDKIVKYVFDKQREMLRKLRRQ